MFLSNVILIVNSPSLQFRPTHVTCKKQINIHYLIFYFLLCSYMQYVFVRIFFQSLLILAYHDSSINCVMTAVISLLMFHRKIWQSLIMWYIYPMPYHVDLQTVHAETPSTCKNGSIYMILRNSLKHVIDADL